MKQTAVDWLFEKMTEQGTNPYWDMRFIQAKDMERIQIKDAYSAGVWEIGCFNRNPDAKKYYEENYEKK
jgi:hypothetical protein